MVRKVSLDEEEHALNILRRLDEMKRDQRHCDFIVSVDGDEYHSHRNILSAGSDYFNAMLTHDTKESQLGKVEMMDVDSECLRICIEYIYTGKADIPDGKIEDLMHASHLMQLDELFKGIVTVLEDDLDIDTYYKTKEIAALYSLENLLSKCKDFTVEYLKLISLHPEFMVEPKKFVLDAIMSENLLATEEEKLIVSLRWVRHEPERAEYLPDFLNAINLKEVSISYRRHLLENESLVANNLHLFQKLSISIMDSLRVQSENKEDFCDNKMMILFDNKSNCLQHFNIQDEEIEKIHDGNINRFWPFSVVYLHPHIYILSENKSVHRLRIHDENAEWEKVKSMSEEHGQYPPVVSSNGCLYVIGGGYPICTASAERYFPDENKWIRLANMPLPNKNATLLSRDEYIYSFGGFRDGKDLDTFSRFTPSKSEWIDLPPMTRAKRSCSATAANQKLYIMGGYDGQQSVTEVDRFDIVTSQWTSLSPMIEPRYYGCAFFMNRMIYVFGGCDGKTWKLIEKYDIKRNIWEKVEISGSCDPSIAWAVTV